MDKLQNPLVAACKVVAAGNRIVLQPEDRGRSFIEDVRSKRRKRIFDRNGVYVLPCWVVKGNLPNAWHRNGWSSWTSRAQMTGRFIRKPNLSFQNKP